MTKKKKKKIKLADTERRLSAILSSLCCATARWYASGGLYCGPSSHVGYLLSCNQALNLQQIKKVS